jgi:hypothetical protein
MHTDNNAQRCAGDFRAGMTLGDLNSRLVRHLDAIIKKLSDIRFLSRIYAPRLGCANPKFTELPRRILQ